MDDLARREPKKLTEKEIEDIRKSIDQMMSIGFTDEEIGRYIPSNWVPQLSQEPMGPVDKRKLPRNPERREQIKEMLLRGESQHKISRELGVSIGTVQYWVEQIGPIESEKKAEEELNSKEVYKKWAEKEVRVAKFWLRVEELRKGGLNSEQAQEQAEKEMKKELRRKEGKEKSL